VIAVTLPLEARTIGKAGRIALAKGKSWAKVLRADNDQENGKAPFPGLFQ
jgi:hypothetical protein